MHAANGFPVGEQRECISFVGPTSWVAARTACVASCKAVDIHGMNGLSGSRTLIGALLEVAFGASPFYFDEIEQGETGVFDVSDSDLASGYVDRDALSFSQRYFKFKHDGYVVPVAPLTGALLQSMTFTSYGLEREPEDWPSWKCLRTGAHVDEFLRSAFRDRRFNRSAYDSQEMQEIQAMQSLLRLNMHRLLNRYSFCTAKIWWEPAHVHWRSTMPCLQLLLYEPLDIAEDERVFN